MAAPVSISLFEISTVCFAGPALVMAVDESAHKIVVLASKIFPKLASYDALVRGGCIVFLQPYLLECCLTSLCITNPQLVGIAILVNNIFIKALLISRLLNAFMVIIEQTKLLLKDPSFLQRKHESAPSFLQKMEGNTRPCIGRDSEIEKITTQLSMPQDKSCVLLGPPGIGKTALCEEIARRVKDKDSSVPHLHNYSFYSLDLNSFTATDGYVGRQEKQTAQLLKFFEKEPGKTILFVDELHGLEGKGISQGHPHDVLEGIKDALSRDNIIIIGTSNDYKWKGLVQKDPAIARRIPSIHIEPPSPRECIQILTSLNESKDFTKTYNPSYVEIDKDIIEALVFLVDILNLDTNSLPDKALRPLRGVVHKRQLEEQKKAKELNNEGNSSLEIEVKKITVDDVINYLFENSDPEKIKKLDKKIIKQKLNEQLKKDRNTESSSVNSRKPSQEEFKGFCSELIKTIRSMNLTLFDPEESLL